MKVKKMGLVLAAMLLVMGLFAGCGGSDEETASNGESREVTVLAAASLTDALDEIIKAMPVPGIWSSRSRAERRAIYLFPRLRPTWMTWRKKV